MNLAPAPDSNSGRSLVVGLGRSGLALARHLVASGAEVHVSDSRPLDAVAEAAAQLPPGVRVLTEADARSGLRGYSAVYASPGVPWQAPLLEAARQLALPVSSEIDLFLRLCPAQVVGITGTNGKTTTTALTGAVLARGRQPVMVGGNIGATVLDRLPELTPDHLVVLELSSFQLESCARPAVRVAVVLNVTPDHLDRHGTFERYVEAKARLVDFLAPDADAVLNGSDPVVRAFATRTRARVTYFDEIEPAPPMPVPGAHNLANARAATAVGRLLGIEEAAIRDAIAAFPGVEHRLEHVGRFDEVDWYNDSKATNPDASQVAVRSFGGRPLVLIAGGHGSGFAVDAWLDDIAAAGATVVLMGESGPELQPLLVARGIPFHPAGSLSEAVWMARSLAMPGYVVLLSPGYKSYDMFTDYEDRGRQFKAEVKLQGGAGAAERG